MVSLDDLVGVIVRAPNFRRGGGLTEVANNQMDKVDRRLAESEAPARAHRRGKGVHLHGLPLEQPSDDHACVSTSVVFITGVSGMIGSHLARVLVAEQCTHVVGLIRPVRAPPYALSSHFLACCCAEFSLSLTTPLSLSLTLSHSLSLTTLSPAPSCPRRMSSHDDASTPRRPARARDVPLWVIH